MADSKKVKMTADQLTDELNMTRQYRGLAVEEEGNSTAAPPLGYVPIALSSQGNLFAPAILHARSFKAGDMAHLSLLRADKLPENNIRVIKDIVSQDLDPSEWHLNEIIEFLLKHYMAYFGPQLKDVAWPVTEEDLKYLEETNKEAYQSYLDGEYVPRIDVQINTLKFNLLDKHARLMTFEGPAGTFKFRPPQFGDIVTLRTYMKSTFADQEAQYEELQQKIKEARKPDSDVTLTDADVEDYQVYMSDRVETAANINMGLLLKEVDGKPVENMREALTYVLQDPRFDFALSQQLKETMDAFADTFGVDPFVKAKNPITNKLESRRLQFRLYDILQAVLVSKPSTYSVTVDP